MQTAPAPGSDPTPAPDRREGRRAELLDAAIRVIRRQGDRVAMEGIAAEAGISRPILYRHFGDVTGLYAAVADRFCRELVARLRPDGEPRSGRALLHRQISTYLAFVADDPNVYRFLTRQPPGSRPRSGPRPAFSRLMADLTAGYLASVGWPPPSAVVAADVFVGGLEVAADRWVDDPVGTHEELAERVTAVLWGGFEALAREVEAAGAGGVEPARPRPGRPARPDLPPAGV
ncbi:MAG TPA: TetR/AcrR family transcriptional regulator [Acidimicrobiales bacterium]